jgi:Leucine-rich repeat (LRR) protein
LSFRENPEKNLKRAGGRSVGSSLARTEAERARKRTYSRDNCIMVEPMAVAIAGKAVSKLLEQMLKATKIAISCNKCCKVLHALLQELQPIMDHAARQISQGNFDNPFKRPRSAVHDWLDELEGTLKRAAVEVNKCIEQQLDLNPVSRYNTGKRILDVTESVRKLLQQAGLVGLAVTFSESSRAQKMEKMMQEIHEMMYDLHKSTLRIEFATLTQNSLKKAHTGSSAEVITRDIKSALDDLLQNLSLGSSDNMTRVDAGASSSSSRPRELIVNEDAHKLTDIKKVPQHVFGVDNFTMKLQRSVTSSRIDAEPRCVGIWGMGGAGKTLLAQIAYNSREVREHFKGGELIWLTVSQTPDIKGLYDSFWRQLGLMPMSFAQLEEYRTRLFTELKRSRVFLVLDDVWNKGVLEQLELAKGPGSVTLVTTRNRPVLEKAGVKDEDEVHVGVLSREDSWQLFCVHAFPRVFPTIPCQLQGVAESVAEECKGLPLALKVSGGSMVGKSMLLEWEFQLNRLRESSELPEEEEEELFGRLKLSYDNLDNDNPVCKECFLGFAAFPEDHRVWMDELIKTWKGQELLVPTCMGNDPTQLAYYLVGLLIGRSMIEVVDNFDSYVCKIHDVMRDLALHIIKGQRPITCLYRPGKKLVEFPRDWIQTYERQPCEVCNLSLMENDLTTLNGVTFSAPKLQLLLLARNERLVAIPRQFVKGIENLKVLDLTACRSLKYLPGEIGNLRKLTHLYLPYCGNLESLPREIGNLRELSHLQLAHSVRFNTLPKEIGNLTQLIHLDLDGCCALKTLPKSIGGLKSLQYFSLFGANPSGLWVKRSRNGQALAAADICKLTTLTTLHISGQNCMTVKLFDQLAQLVKLNKIRIHRFVKLETLSDSIQLMVDLEELMVSSCERIKILPQFITLFSNLKDLRLCSMSSLESLPALNTLKMLSTLWIYNCKSIKHLPVSFTSSDAFPSLNELNCSRSGLVEFLEVEDGAMRKLQILELDGTDIKRLPDTLIKLKNLKVVYICKDRFDNLCKNFENTWLLSKFSLRW